METRRCASWRLRSFPLTHAVWVEELGLLLALAAGQTARLLNVTDLAAPFSLSRPTIRDYVTLLARIFLLEELPPWHSNRLSRLVKTPKVHLVDTGVATTLLGLDARALHADRPTLGQLLETFVYQELRRLASARHDEVRFHHFRDKDGYEVDVVLERGGRQLAGIEIKAAATVTHADFRGLRKLRAAAGQLGLTESAVSHQIKKLEKFLGAALFERHGRELRLTAAGARFHRAIQPALVALQAATDDLMGAPSRQRVTITAPTSIAAFWLIPRMAKLQQHHPSIDLQLVATNRLCDLAREQIDLAIRYGTGQWRGLDVRELMPELYFPVASAAFLRKHGTRDPAEVLKTSRIISNALHPDEWTEWCNAHGLQPPRTSNMIALSSAELVVPAVLDGVGIGMGRRPIIDPLLKDLQLLVDKRS